MGCNCKNMPIQDNQYKDAPQQAPYIMGADQPSVEEIQLSSKEYRRELIGRILEFDMCLVARVKEAHYLLDIDSKEVPIVQGVVGGKAYSWNMNRLKDQPTQVLINMYTFISNTDEILKEDPRLLS